MISKLLLVRKVNSQSDLLDKADLKGFFKGKPISISPAKWSVEAGLTHYGYLLQGMKLADLERLVKFVDSNEGLSLHDFKDDVNGSLAVVGLKVNEAA